MKFIRIGLLVFMLLFSNMLVLTIAYNYNNQKSPEIIQLTESLKNNPYDAEVFYKLGVAYVNNKDLEQALPYFERAVQINSSFAAAYFMIGSICAKTNKHQRAAEAFKQALTLDNNYACLEQVIYRLLREVHF